MISFTDSRSSPTAYDSMGKSLSIEYMRLANMINILKIADGFAEVLDTAMWFLISL